MTIIVDRRLNGKNKSATNRQKFLDRFKNAIRNVVKNNLAKRNIQDFSKGQKIRIREDMDEPSFRKAAGSSGEKVYTGNDRFIKGDKEYYKQGHGVGGAGDEPGEDIIDLELSEEEVLNIFFEDLELPNMIKKSLGDTEEFKLKRAGFVSNGIPSNLNIIRSFKNSIGRRLAMQASIRGSLEEAEEKLFNLYGTEDPSEEQKRDSEAVAIEEEINELQQKLESVPYIEDLDLRYNHRVKVPEPSLSAVMICLMDVSGSMDADRKDIARRFLMLLYQFLKVNYEKIDLVFVKHREQAFEVSQHEFFHSAPSGGTKVSSGLKLVNTIIDERYKGKNYNVYVAYAGDGENFDDDNVRCEHYLEELVKKVQYFCYLQVGNLRWTNYVNVFVKMMEILAEQNENVGYAPCDEVKEIYPVFRKLFEKKQ